jgi:hypothetical protein
MSQVPAATDAEIAEWKRTAYMPTMVLQLIARIEQEKKRAEAAEAALAALRVPQEPTVPEDWSVKPGWYPSGEGGDTDWWFIGRNIMVNAPEVDARLMASAKELKARAEAAEATAVRLTLYASELERNMAEYQAEAERYRQRWLNDREVIIEHTGVRADVKRMFQQTGETLGVTDMEPTTRTLDASNDNLFELACRRVMKAMKP